MLLENVKGLLSMTVNYRKMHLKIISDLQQLGYGVVWKVLNSKDYGTPQNRERIWFVCKLGGWDFMEFMFPEKEELKISGKDLLEQNINKEYYLNEEQINKINKRTRFGDSIINLDDGIIQKHMNEISSYFIHFPTLTCVDTQNIFIKKENTLRKLTKKECFRIMGFFNDEINTNNLTNNQCYKLAGNGWDINLVSKIFKRMFKN